MPSAKGFSSENIFLTASPDTAFDFPFRKVIDALHVYAENSKTYYSEISPKCQDIFEIFLKIFKSPDGFFIFL